jgi:hypothetical protein
MRQDDRQLEQKRLQEQTHRNLLHLIDSELNLALTMTELAETESEVGDDAHGRVLLEKVEQAMDSVRQHVVNHGVSIDEKSRLRRGCTDSCSG